MLKLTYTPTSEITDRDLVPGSKWRRKSDGVECVLLRSASAGQIQWCLAHNGDLLWNRGEWQIVQPGSMLTWLRRDFERVGCEIGNRTRCCDVPFGHVFAAREFFYLSVDSNSTTRCVIARRLDSVGGAGLVNIRYDDLVRDLGPIEIDDSVKGVG